MFHNIDAAIRERMQYLEQLHATDQHDGTQVFDRLRQIPPDTGKFLALTAANCPDGQWLEIGTSGGYSTLWLALAAKERGAYIKTFELAPAKIALARETFAACRLTDMIEVVEGDALENIERVSNISFCFLDCEKELYAPCWEKLASRMNFGGMLLADNAISHAEGVRPMMEMALRDARFDCLVVPIGQGVLVCRRVLG